MPVRSINRVVALLMLAVWLPATSHCMLETAGIIPTDECCQTPEFPTQDPHDCRDGCASFEDSFYKVKEQIPGDLTPFQILVSLPAIEPTVVAPSVMNSGWPPGALSLREFVIRTSQPIRGPSIVS